VTTRRVLAALVLVGASACTEAVTVEPLPSSEYRTWSSVAVTGKVPGHGDTYRLIYYQPRSSPGAFTLGDALVKEVYDEEGGPLSKVYFMRFTKPLADQYGYEDEGGWLFTETTELDGEERYNSICWRTCHAAAPYRGVWLNY